MIVQNLQATVSDLSARLNDRVFDLFVEKLLSREEVSEDLLILVKKYKDLLRIYTRHKIIRHQINKKNQEGWYSKPDNHFSSLTLFDLHVNNSRNDKNAVKHQLFGLFGLNNQEIHQINRGDKFQEI